MIPVVATALVFATVVTLPFVNWDDPNHVLDNTEVVSPLGRGIAPLLLTPRLGYPVPVLVLSFALDHALFGFSPAAFHAVNVVLHVLNVALVATLGLRLGLTRARAAWASGLFGLHPLVVEPVAWVTGRKDLLATTLLLLAAVLVVRAVERGRWRAWALAETLALLAMLAKPSAVVGPVLLWLVAAPRVSGKRAAIWLSPLAVAVSLLTVAGVIGQRRAGVINTARSWSDAFFDVTAGWALQVRHLLWPTDLLPAYYRETGNPGALAIAFGAAFLIFLLWRAARSKVAVERTGIVFALAAYAPASNAFAIQRWICDSYMYLPLVGLALALASSARMPRLKVAGLIAAAPIAAMAILSFAQTSIWSSSVALWQPVLRAYPNQPNALARLALAYHYEGHDQQATKLFQRLDELYPDSLEELRGRAWAMVILDRPDRSVELLARAVHHGCCAPDLWHVLGQRPALAAQVDDQSLRLSAQQMEHLAHEGRQPPSWLATMLRTLVERGLGAEAARVQAAYEQARPLAGPNQTTSN